MKTIVLTLKKGKVTNRKNAWFGTKYADNILGYKKIVLVEQRIHFTEPAVNWKSAEKGTVRYEYAYLAVADGELTYIPEGDLWDAMWAYDAKIGE